MKCSGPQPATDWPLVESNRKEWEEWMKAAPPDTFKVVLIGEPIGKGRPRSRIVTPRCKKCRGAGCRACKGTGKGPQFISVYTPRETEKYEEALALAGRNAIKSKPPLEGPLRVRVTAIMGVPPSWSAKKKTAALHGSLRPCVSPDWDNIGKTLDALNGVVWVDDKQIVDGGIKKFYGQLPRLEIEITPIEAAGLFSTQEDDDAE